MATRDATDIPSASAAVAHPKNAFRAPSGQGGVAAFREDGSEATVLKGTRLNEPVVHQGSDGRSGERSGSCAGATVAASTSAPRAAGRSGPRSPFHPRFSDSRASSRPSRRYPHSDDVPDPESPHDRSQRLPARSTEAAEWSTGGGPGRSDGASQLRTNPTTLGTYRNMSLRSHATLKLLRK